MKKYYIPFLLVSCMLFFGCNKNSTATETETTQSTPSKKFKENVNKSCTYIAYRDKVIVLDNKNNIATLLTNLLLKKYILVVLIMFYMVFHMPMIQQIKTVKKMKIKKIKILT